LNEVGRVVVDSFFCFGWNHELTSS
jgi:hypothetical protein